MRSSALETYKQRLSLTNEQREVLVGIILGDAHLETQNGGRTFRLKIEQSIKHEAYINHLYLLFRDWVRTPPQVKRVRSQNAESCNVWFQTLSHEAFRFYAHQFVDEKVKRVPPLIHKWLTPRAIAYWYMDDGSIKSAESKGVIFNTQAFKLVDIERLCAVLHEQHGLIATPRRQREGHQIYVSGKSFEAFTDLVKPYVITEMNYKLPSARKTQLPKE